MRTLRQICLLLMLSFFFLQGKAQVLLANPEMALSLIATDSTRAKHFFLNCLGLNHNSTLSMTGMKMFLFGCGQATVKVRVYNTDPPPQNPELTAANGFRFLTIPVNNFDTVVALLNNYAFAPPLVRTESGVRTAMAKGGDGNVVEILDAATSPGRKLEIGLLASSADSLGIFYQNILNFPMANPVAGPAPVDSATEYRYAANNTIIRIFERPGNRPSDTCIMSGVQGYRYITFTLLADVDILYQTMLDSGITVAVSLAPYGSSYYLFMVRGPGGALHEFLGPLHVVTQTAFTDMEFVADYFAPAMPANDTLAQTLEANALVVHNGKIYCATTYGGPSGIPSTSDPKILVKDTADGNWRIDYHGTNKFVRFPIIRSVNFTSDANGNDLPQPTPVMVAGTGAWRSWNPDGVYVISRNDNTGQWVESKLSDHCWNIANAKGFNN